MLVWRIKCLGIDTAGVLVAGSSVSEVIEKGVFFVEHFLNASCKI